jgi:hypothetical protein
MMENGYKGKDMGEELTAIRWGISILVNGNEVRSRGEVF